MNGVLYFGNAGGILQYDGITWTYIPVKNQNVWIKSLALGAGNTIYVGGQSEFGYLAPEESGILSYVSLSDQLTDKQVSFSDIIRLWTWKNNVAFQSEEALFIYTDGELTTILPETSFHLSFLVDDELYIRQRGVGLMKLTGKSLQLVSGSKYLKDFGIKSILKSTDPSKFIILTAANGFWSVNKETFAGSPINIPDSTLFRKSEIYDAVRLNDGKIAISTLSNGIIITDESFKILYVLNKEKGLKVNSVNSLLQDYQGNIWAGLDNGIVQVHYSSPVSIFGPETGLSGNIRAIKRYKGKLFIGTTDGLFVQNESYRMLSASFIPFGSMAKEIKGICLAGDRLLIGLRDELYEITDNGIHKIDNIEINSVYYSENLKILFVSGKNSLALYRYKGSWKLIKDIPEISEDVVRFEEETGKKNVTIWMGTALEGVIRMQFTGSLEYKIDKYNSSDGLIDKSWVFPFKINNNLVFSQRNGLLSFVDENTIKNQLPDSLKDQPEFYKGYFDLFSLDTSNERINKPFYIIEDTKNRIYSFLDGDLGYFDKTNVLSFLKEPFSLTDIGKINVIFHEDTGICWIGGDDGLLRFDENNFKNYSLDFNTIITNVACGPKNKELYSGYGENTQLEPDKSKEVKSWTISHDLNTVTFAFAAPFFEGQEKILYSSMLIGKDTIFSPWSIDNKIVFRNLWEGNYSFSVKAMNAYGHISSQKDFTFRVLSPWYRKTWAYLLYIILGIAAIFTGIRLYTRRLIAQNKKLENIIRQRTHEIHEKNIELEKQKQEILDSINYAQRIQNAVLPNEDMIHNWLGDHFILYRPKDIVSGDFYWSTIYNQYVVFCVADCTGHGVPGAFMSMLCISLLNEIVCKDKVNHTDVILNNVRKKVIEALQQKGIMGEQKDGMDIAICIYNRETSKLEFSGANSPLIIIRKKDKEPIPCIKQFEYLEYNLYEIKGDRMPVSFYDRMDPFKRCTFNLLKDDRLYLYSDGICDQFGGPKGRRFMNNSVRTTLLETLTPEIKDQKQLMEERVDEWQAHINPRTGHPYDQVDDICMMGIKI